MGTLAVAGIALLLASCSRLSTPVESVIASAPPTAEPTERIVRTSGTIQALRALSVRVPQISGQQSRVTLTRLAPNGTRVRQGDPIVEFDRTTLLDEAREAEAKISDLKHQTEERLAKARSDAAKRTAQIREAEADMAKARIQLRKGPVLSDIERRKNQVTAEAAEARVASLNKSHRFHELEEEAAVKVMERKLERQRVALERIRTNLERLLIKAPQDGMIALENIWRSGSMGPPQEGDQMFPGQPVLRIFDPTSMIVEAMVNEPDIAALNGTTRAKLYLDAYPTAVFDAVLESASPVATSGLDSPVRTFSARFLVEQQDPRLLPDLSASLELRIHNPSPSKVSVNVLPAKGVTP